MKYFFKNHLLRIFYKINLFKVIKGITGRKHVIFTFHKVIPFSKKVKFDTCPVVTPENFEFILKYIMKHYKIVPLEFLVENLHNKNMLASITFDDGWRNNYTNAYPILKKHRTPATIFVTTKKIGSSIPFWQQQLGDYFHKNIIYNKPGKKKIDHFFGVKQPSAFNYIDYLNVVSNLKMHSFKTIENIMSNLAIINHNKKKRIFINENEIKLMGNEGLITFGSHTENHVILPNESQNSIKNELLHSKMTLEKILNKKVSMISYPNGNYSEKVVKQAKFEGYSIGCTTKISCLGPNIDRMLLPRIDTEWDNLFGKRMKFKPELFYWITK